MKKPSTANRLFLSGLTGMLATSVIFLAGCASAFNPTSTEPAPLSPGGTIMGTVHGGQQPIYNAVVRLYSAGTSGYGTGSTLLATSLNTSTTGAFAFAKLGTTGGVINSALPTWQCPASGDPQIYITAVGGNTQGTGVTTTNNASSALIASLGPCSTVTSATQATINEITTVATVFAMAQYINPGTTPGTETIGTSSSLQGTVGLNNAVSGITNLASIANGTAVTSNPYTGTGAALGVTVTATPESAKLITIADILASCINTVSNTSNNCVDLFANALPPPIASVTSQPSATFGTAQDTIQAAYYMAVNPIDAGTFTSCNAGGATTLGCLFLLASSNPPFAGTLGAAPTDWTIGVSYASSGNCTNGQPFLLGPNKTAVDANGNIWFVNGASSGANWGELGKTGTPLNCGGNNLAGRGLTIDPTGNVWISYNNTTLPGSIQEVRADNGSSVSWTPTATPYSIVADGSGNIYSVNTSNGASLYEFAAPGTNYSATSPTLQVGGIFNLSGATNVGYIGADSTGRILMTSSSVGTGGVGEALSGATAGSATITGFSATTTAVTFTTTSMPTFAVNQSVSVSGLASASIGLTGYSENSGNTSATFTTATAPPFTVGQQVTISGFTTTAGAKYSGITGAVTAVASTSPYSFTLTMAGTASASSITDTGTATLYNGTLNEGHLVTAVTATGFTITFATSPALSASVTDNGTVAVLPYSRGVVATAISNNVYGAGIDSSANVYTGTTCCSSAAATTYRNLIKVSPDPTTLGAGTSASTPSYFAGDIGVRSVAVDGAANQWFGNELSATSTTYSVGEAAWSSNIAITGFSSTTTSVTFNTSVAPPSFPGESVYISGLGTGTQYNGKNGFVTAVNSNSFTVTISGTATAQTADSGTAVFALPLSTSGSAANVAAATPNTCTTTACYAGGGFQKASLLQAIDMAVDPSGNLWVMNTGTGSSIVYTGTNITEIVGAAVPVVTPLSVGAKNGTLGTKP